MQVLHALETVSETCDGRLGFDFKRSDWSVSKRL